MNLTVVVLTKNESANLPQCLNSLAPGVSILVVDSQSTDQTVQLAKDHGAEVIETHEWKGFGHQRNLALGHVKTRWVMFLDADERIQSKTWDEIQDAIIESRSCAYSFPRLTNFAGSWIRYCGWYPDHVTRMFQVGQARYSDDLVHERVMLSPQVDLKAFKTPLLHFSYPDPAHYWKKMQSYSMAWAQQHHALGKKTSLMRAVLSSGFAFLRSYVFRLGFLDGVSGLAVCLMQAQATYSKYFMLYWMNRSK